MFPVTICSSSSCVAVLSHLPVIQQTEKIMSAVDASLTGGILTMSPVAGFTFSLAGRTYERLASFRAIASMTIAIPGVSFSLPSFERSSPIPIPIVLALDERRGLIIRSDKLKSSIPDIISVKKGALSSKLLIAFLRSTSAKPCPNSDSMLSGVRKASHEIGINRFDSASILEPRASDPRADIRCSCKHNKNGDTRTSRPVVAFLHSTLSNHLPSKKLRRKNCGQQSHNR